MINRKLTVTLKKLPHNNKAIIILGARQVGKTTVLQKLFKNKEKVIFLNGDEPDTKEMLTGANSVQISQLFLNYNIIVIDEAQMIPDIGIVMKLITDYVKGKKLYISGSSSLELANITNEPLTGRKYEFNLFPLSFQEMVDHHGLIMEKRMINTRLIFGYYPEIVTTPGGEIRLLKNLAGSYLYKDILSFGQIKKPVILDKLLKLLAHQVGNEVSFYELSQNLGVDKETVERYIDLLEKAFIIFKLNALSRNVRNEIKKGKKIFFYDNGIRNSLIGNFLPWEKRTDKGALWENFIISERIKKTTYDEFYGNHYFWRTTQRQEIDLIEEKDGMFSVFEFKVNPRKSSKIPLTFSKSYDVSTYEVINPNNLEKILLD